MQAFDARMRALREEFKALSAEDLRALSQGLVAHFEQHSTPLDAAARRDVLRYLDAHRDALITLASATMFTGGLTFGAALTDRLLAGDMSYLLVNIGGWIFPLQQIFGVASDGSVQKFSQRVMQVLGKQMGGAPIEAPVFTSPALATLSQKAKAFGAYAVEHRQQIIAEWILVAETLVTAGWGAVALNGDPYAAASFVPGVFACAFHAVTVGQNYHRNYVQEGKPEPTALGLPNARMAKAVARQVQRIPEQVQPWLPGLSLVTTQLMMAPNVMRGFDQGNVAEVIGTLMLMAGLGAMYTGYMVPPVRQVLSKEDATLFRQQWNIVLQGYVQHRPASDEPAADMQRFSDAIDGFAFLKPIDRAVLRDDTRDVLGVAHDQHPKRWEQRVTGTEVGTHER